MPKRFLTYSRTEPARTILWSVSVLSCFFELLGLVIGLGAFGMTAALIIIPDALIVVAFAGWAVWAAAHNNMRQMSYASFVMFLFWLFTGLLRLFTVDGVGELLWAPYLIIAMVMATVFLYLSNQRRMSDLD